MRTGLRVFTALVTAAAFIAPVSAQKHAKPPLVKDDASTILHVLNRIGFGPAPGDIEKVRRIGVAEYIDRQLHPEDIKDDAITSRLNGFDTIGLSSSRLADEYFMPAELKRQRRQQGAPRAVMNADTPPPEPGGDRQVFLELASQKILRAVYSERQLQEVMVDFWFNHFNVFAGKGATRIYLTEYEREAIRPRVLGNFRELLGAVAASPAMLFYLDNWQSSAAGGRRGGLNENYARELMELHTLGVEGGYTQADVEEVARAFTGWTIDRPRAGGSFVFRPRQHDDGPKVVLGHRLKAGGGQEDGDRVLDILAQHPSTAEFIATKLARRFVADDPPASLVERAAATFRDTHGEIRDVVRTIVTSPEFFAPSARRAKIKSPYEFVVSAVRATGIDVRQAAPLVQAVRQLGMPLYMCQPPTGYGDVASAWVNSGALLARMNFAVLLSGGNARRLGIVPETAGVRDVLLTGVLGDDISPATRDTIAKAERPAQSVALILGSPEFQRR